jgi:hypothetical protein
MGLSELLRRHGFESHPFETFIAESEKNLPEWFVPPAFLPNIAGDAGGTSLSPRSHLVFGRPGDGKTAIRLTLERELERRAPNVLVLRYIDFSRPLRADKRPPLGEHIDELLRLGTIALVSVWQSDPAQYAALSHGHKSELAWLVDRYYEQLPPQVRETYAGRISPLNNRVRRLLTQGVRAAVDAYNATISVLKQEKIEPIQWESSAAASQSGLDDPFMRLQRFWGVVNAFKVESVWVLIDKVDESTATVEAEAIFKCIADLLLTPTIMEYRVDEKQVICFKVFLTHPAEVEPMLKAAGFRRDRIKVESIKWTRKDLDTALQRRLSHFSKLNVSNFDNLCAADAIGTHDRLLDECGLRPRTLFRFAHEIFGQLQLTNDPTIEKFSRSMVDAGIAAGKEATVG